MAKNMSTNKKHLRSRSFLMRGSFIGLIGFSAIAGLIITGTRPETLGLLGVVGFFLVLYGAVFSLLLLFYGLRQRQRPLEFRGALKVAILALAPVMLLAMNSTSPLGLLDVLLVFSFQVAALFYVSRIV